MSFIKPEVYAQLTREKFVGKIKIASLAKDLGYLVNTNVGETVSFPKFNAIGEAIDVVKGTAITTSELSQTENKATIKMVAAPGVRVYDIEDMTALGNQIDESATQQGIVIARKVDVDLAVEARTSSLKSATAGANVITSTELLTALALYGDDRDTEDFAGIVINSLLYGSFIGMPEFTSVEKTYATMGNGIVRNGLIGFFLGIPVYMADHGTHDSVTNECITYVIKKDALGLMTKRNINVEEERHASLFCSDIFSNMIYAVKLIMEDGIVVVRKTIV
jgi:hypothetical protein